MSPGWQASPPANIRVAIPVANNRSASPMLARDGLLATGQVRDGCICQK
jgi:hypothetical protein